MKRVLLILLVFGGVTPCCGADEVYGETQDKDYWFLTLVAPPDRITLSEMEKRARAFLERAASRKVAVLSVFNTREIAAAERGSSCHSYKQWKVYYDLFPRDRLVAGSVIAIGGGAVLRLRSAEGMVTQRVLNGKDPTRFSIDGTRFEILIVAGRSMTRFQACGTPGAIEPTLYIRAETDLDPNRCQRATNWLAKTLRTRHLSATFRNDHWFPCSQFFPVLYPFFRPEPPPSESAYHNSLSFTCRIWCDGTAGCTETM
jgi:hypothetical protein